MDIKTKIIATIGPACEKTDTLQAMMDAGVNAFRLNMSHGDNVTKRKLYDLVNTLKLFDGQRPCILTDLAGPKIRITDVLPNLTLEAGQSIMITNENDADENHISVTSNIGFKNVFEGAKILINDGRIKLEVKKLFQPIHLNAKQLLEGLLNQGKE